MSQPQQTPLEQEFANGRVRKPEEYSTEIGSDGIGFSDYVEWDMDESMPRFEKIKRKSKKPK